MALTKYQFESAVSVLAGSVYDLHERFGNKGYNFDKEIDLKVEVGFRQKMFASEFAEVVVALAEHDNENLKEELVDLLYVALGSVLMMNDEALGAIDKVIIKNDAKTLDTHYVNDDNKIVRREKNG